MTDIMTAPAVVKAMENGGSSDKQPIRAAIVRAAELARDAEEHARKPSSYYMRVYKEARRRSVEEFAVALGVSEQDADARLHAAAVAAGEIADNSGAWGGPRRLPRARPPGR